jgi:chitin synthase
MSDNRLTSPPPLLQQHSSASDMSFPPSNRQSFGGPMGAPGYDDQGDMNDSAPLLNHAQPTFGLPQHNSGYHHAAGDMGMLPGQGANGGYSNSSIGFNGPNGHGLEPSMDDHQNNVHYGPVPNRVIRRNRTQKRVK